MPVESPPAERPSVSPLGLDVRAGQGPTPAVEPVIRAEKLTIRYGDFAAVRNVSLDIPPRQVTAIIGPSGCGKNTLLRAMNRMNDFIPNMTVEGRLSYRGQDVYGPNWDPVELRRRVGMVFQKPNPFPKSIFKNVTWGAAINGYRGNLAELASNRSAAPPCGTRSRMNSTRARWPSPGDSSSVCASPAPPPCSRTCC